MLLRQFGLTFLSQRPTGRGGSGNIRQNVRPSVGTFEENRVDKVTSPSGREITTRGGSVSSRSGDITSYINTYQQPYSRHSPEEVVSEM